MAEAFDGLRFSGPIGRLIAETQERVIAGFLEPLAERTVLDVGTGTGRAAIALARAAPASPAWMPRREMLAVARRRAAEASVDVAFLPGRRAWAGVCGSLLRRRRLPAGADAHAGLAAVAGRTVPRRARARGRSTTRRSGARRRSRPRLARDVHALRRAGRGVSSISQTAP